MATFFDERQRLIAIILLSPLFRGSRYGSATLIRKCGYSHGITISASTLTDSTDLLANEGFTVMS